MQKYWQMAKEWMDRNFTLRGLSGFVLWLVVQIPDWLARHDYWKGKLHSAYTFLLTPFGDLVLIIFGILVIWLDHRSVIKKRGHGLQVVAYGEVSPPINQRNSIMLQARVLSTISGRREPKPPNIPPAEEDPRVFLDPLNEEFVARGYMAFKISNKGQRVNPAQSVNIRPINNLPSVVFDYIDRIDPATELIIAPNVGDGLLVQNHDMLPELRQAWSNAHERGEIDSDEFAFKIIIHYRDAKHIKFISEISMKYFPIQENAAHRNAMSSRPTVYPILKVTNTEIMRLL